MIAVASVLLLIGLKPSIHTQVNSTVLTILILLEVLLLIVTVQFIYIGGAQDDLLSTLFALFIILIAGAESAIGLSILVSYYQLRGFISSTI